MNFKLPIYRIGVTQDINNTIKIAILQKTCKEWIVAYCAHIGENNTELLPKKYREALCIFSLKGSDSLIKSSLSSLKNKRNILKTTLTDLETHAIFPWESLVISPHIGKKDACKTTPITLWITQKDTIERKVSLLHQSQVFPDTISCQPADIFFLAQQTPLKALPAYFLIYTGSLETTCLFVKNESVLVSRSFHNSSPEYHENIVTTLNYIKDTYPTIPLSVIHVMGLSPELKKSLEQKINLPLVPCQITTLNVDEATWLNYGDAIISAYHGTSRKIVAFPYNPMFNSTASQKFWLKRTTRLISKFALISTLIVGTDSMLKLSSLSHRVRDNFALVCPESKKIPSSLRTIKTALFSALSSYNTHKEYAYLPTIPTSKETMQFLSAISEPTPSIKLSYFCYSLISFPSKQTPNVPYEATVSIKGEGNSEEISQFLQRIYQHPKLSKITKTQCGQTFELQFNIASEEIL
ncbi:hypothetical protein BOKEGFJH_00750 [Chlamydia avium]|uniref:Inner membrane protein n=1 Tax=Chlamydia avium TaxID=1457141 RepID=A0ABP2X6W8_9CHLA|nr:hypothetical protein [Chlamydia avium]EPP36206.1 hypothetical protein CP10743SC13_0115 [Chlamydia psittaci 10_743_SC13]EPP38584.1 hypothetical protein CP10881SC42_0202 [Chlamydia avium]VVT43214.1 hypothetical protein BOKEGFJH_00750 [Chlamydia avium]